MSEYRSAAFPSPQPSPPLGERGFCGRLITLSRNAGEERPGVQRREVRAPDRAGRCAIDSGRAAAPNIG